MKKLLLIAVVVGFIAACSGKDENHNMEDNKMSGQHDMMGMKNDGVDNGVVFREARTGEVGKPVVCPVMGTKFKVKAKTQVADYKGKSYYFCCAGCPGPFKSDPEKYINKPASMPGDKSGMMKKKQGMLSGEIVDGVREINIKAFQFGFSPDTIIVKKGEKIRLKAISTDVNHGIGIKDYKIKRKLPAKQEQIIEFTADKSGEFHFHCSIYCGAGHGKMHGKMIVKE
ncbi:cupredoxin domain-containing protein [bacterium]|nr:YHS domain-containing protein [Candidatus Omnitrophota bacterium]MBU2527923.1 cupredoxin domain-containing protein [bacterium]MBU3929276.1 cupredoxin domain-containing protein [bacterium]